VDNRRFLIAALLSLLVLVVWQWLTPAPPPRSIPVAPSPQTLPAEEAKGAGTAEEPSAARSEAENGEEPVAEVVLGPPIGGQFEERIEVATDRYVAVLSSRGGDVQSFRLVRRPDADGQPVELVRERTEAIAGAFGWIGGAGERLAVDRELFAVERPDPYQVRFRYRGPAGDAEKVYRFEPDLFTVEASLTGSSGAWGLLIGPGVRNPSVSELTDRFRKADRRVSYGAGGEMEALAATKAKGPTVLPGDAVSWVGVEDKYFLAAWLPERGLSEIVVTPVANRLPEGGRVVSERLVLESETAEDDPDTHDLALGLIADGDRLSGRAYWGAKAYLDLRRLARQGEAPPSLPGVVRWGFFGLFAKGLLLGLRWIHEHLVDNWGWAIVLMTVAIKIVLFPLTHKSYVSMQRMQKLNPKMEAIRHRYKPKLRGKDGRPNLDMQRQMNEEIQQLFRDEGVNPLGGCLPILVQMPVFLGFYALLAQAVELWNAPWVLWIADLTAKDPYYVLPLLMGATQFVTTKMMPAPANPTQRIIMTTMPIWFTVISLGFPSGLVLYWLTNNVLTIVQQAGYNRLKKSGFLGGEGDASAMETSRSEKGKGRKS
jgi:YidC/Oxa1 family membrane protein insertase